MGGWLQVSGPTYVESTFRHRGGHEAGGAGKGEENYGGREKERPGHGGGT